MIADEEGQFRANGRHPLHQNTFIAVRTPARQETAIKKEHRSNNKIIIHKQEQYWEIEERKSREGRRSVGANSTCRSNVAYSAVAFGPDVGLSVLGRGALG